ncbi:hypothetical protein BDZ89DRAFT_1035788 [Hymenopellis radicata]|nr:hypothetical protein BDZ89DRAFT_1035788 [Hymenopellis radicata]
MSSGRSYIEWVKGHSGVEEIEETDKLAAKGCEMTPRHLGNPTVLSRLSKTECDNTIESTQDHPKEENGAYKESMNRTDTQRNIKLAIAAGSEHLENEPSPMRIWMSIRNKRTSSLGTEIT